MRIKIKRLIKSLLNLIIGRNILVLIILSGIFIVYLFNSKKHDVIPSFYFWKTTFLLTPREKSVLNNLKVKRLYVRYFDIDFAETDRQPMTVAEINFEERPIPGFEIIPVVFLTNKTLLRSTENQLKSLSQLLYYKVTSISESHSIQFSQIQLDCDWSEKSRQKYLFLVNLLKEILHAEGKTLSATIRLHQIKYPGITGIPSADRGMLMFYNMGPISPDTNISSIFDPGEALKYLGYIKRYPLPLDVALPLFSHAIHLRKARPVELLSESFINSLKSDPRFRKVSNNYYVCDSSFFFHGDYFLREDSFKIEEINSIRALEASRLLADNINKTDRSVSLFDLDQDNINGYRDEDFEKIFDCFH
jgi:hypothetical protein